MKQGILIIDYGMGNLNSVKRKFSRIGINALISNLTSDISKADKLILPGVGHFQKAVENIRKLQLWDEINETVLIKKKPILGICLGMQLMANFSEEGNCTGLGWFDAEVVKFRIKDDLKFKIPHMGWNQIRSLKNSQLMNNIPELSEFYFVHSYYIRCNNEEDKLNESEYECTFTSAIEKENIFGVQYHPEKSHDVGEQLLKNFVNM
jgi:imidazole glycerol-phosphate synthase subunit HisH